VLQRRFNTLLGHTIHDQIISQRLKLAIELISGTGLSLAEVADRCGFPHPEYMWAVFQKRLNKTPMQFRPPTGSNSRSSQTGNR
jgi:LacI family transcriptional regulator